MTAEATLLARIVADLRAHIESGDWPPGARIPSIRELRTQHGCSDQPVRSALLTLQASGWLRGERRVGVFVVDDPPIA